MGKARCMKLHDGDLMYLPITKFSAIRNGQNQP
jgi:hypothetical protein